MCIAPGCGKAIPRGRRASKSTWVYPKHSRLAYNKSTRIHINDRGYMAVFFCMQSGTPSWNSKRKRASAPITRLNDASLFIFSILKRIVQYPFVDRRNALTGVAPRAGKDTLVFRKRQGLEMHEGERAWADAWDLSLE